MKKREPAKAKPSASKYVRRVLCKKQDGSVKEIARKAAADGNEKAADWLFNKSANFSKPPLGIGRTRKRKK